MTTQSASAEKSQTIGNLLETKEFRQQLKMALPRHLSVEKMVRMFMTELVHSPKLRQCTLTSLASTFIQCGQVGLEPGSVLGHAYLVPFYNGRTKNTECKLIIGYRGMIELARRSGHVRIIYAHAVYERDEFSYEYGLLPQLIHKPALDSERGEMIGAYAVVLLDTGDTQFEFMPKWKIQKIRDRAKSQKESPWDSDTEEMWRKTAVRRLFKYLPVSIEMSRAVGIDEESENGKIYEAINDDLMDKEAKPLSRTQELVKKFSKDDSLNAETDLANEETTQLENEDKVS